MERFTELAMYRQLRELWKSPEKSELKELIRSRAICWRRGPVAIRLEKPTRLDKARALGYKAKPGYIVVRVRVRRGGLRKLRPKGGRRQKKMGVSKFTPAKSIKQIAQERVAKRYPNMRVLSSYWIWQDGKYKWFEVLLFDPNHSATKR